MSDKPSMKPKLNPSTKHREFFGLPGTVAITFVLPIVILFFALVTNETYSFTGIDLQWEPIQKQLPQTWSEFVELGFDGKVWAAYLTWFFGLVIIDAILPGKHLQGIELRDGTKLDYKINGISLSAILIAVLSARLFTSDNYYLPELQFIYDNQLKLTITVIIFSFLLSLFVYFISFIPLTQPNGTGSYERILSINGNTGNPFYDWFIGRELNPRIGSWDIKLFCELKPGLLLWFLINLSCIQHQYQLHGKVSDSLVLLNVLEAFYLFDGVLNEEGCLSMMDITTDGFGFMLCFGDLAWVPFSYSLQARYLSLSDKYYTLGWLNCGFIVAVSALGYYIFHSSNKQKSDFKSGRLNHLKSIPTKTGTKLLCDGWWKLSQHTNYFGDWLIGWSWCLPTGFQTPLTYFYVIYFGTLLIHRQGRDEAKCRAKYGEAWEEYERQVPYKIVPYLY